MNTQKNSVKDPNETILLYQDRELVKALLKSRIKELPNSLVRRILKLYLKHLDSNIFVLKSLTFNVKEYFNEPNDLTLFEKKKYFFRTTRLGKQRFIEAFSRISGLQIDPKEVIVFYDKVQQKRLKTESRKKKNERKYVPVCNWMIFDQEKTGIIHTKDFKPVSVFSFKSENVEQKPSYFIFNRKKMKKIKNDEKIPVFEPIPYSAELRMFLNRHD